MFEIASIQLKSNVILRKLPLVLLRSYVQAKALKLTLVDLIILSYEHTGIRTHTLVNLLFRVIYIFLQNSLNLLIRKKLLKARIADAESMHTKEG